MYCTRCGTENKDDSRFCTSCGGQLQEIDITSINTNKINDEEIRTKKFEKINTENIFKDRNILIIAVLSIVIIIFASMIFLSNQYTNSDDDNEDLTVIQDTDGTIVIPGGQDQNLHNKDTAEVSILSFPPGAEIYINNISKGDTPMKINLPEGNYSLKTKLIGYKTILSNFNVTVKPGYDTDISINITLEPIE